MGGCCALDSVTHLGLEDADVDAITTNVSYIQLQSVKYELLVKWKHANGNEATPRKLFDYLIAEDIGVKRLKQAAKFLKIPGM